MKHEWELAISKYASIPSRSMLVLVTFLLGFAFPGMATAQARAGEEAFGKLPLYFVQNQGQLDARVAYYVQGRDTTVYFTSEGVTIALTGPAATAASDGEGARQRWAVKLDFVGANLEARPRGQDPTSAVISYFKGPSQQWKTGLRTYAGLVYRDLWPGIDLVFNGTVNRLKYTFLIHPGADPDRIKLAYRGATAVRLTSGGELEVSTPVGGFRDERPYAYQDVGGQRVEVAAAYAMDPEASDGVQDYGFRLGAYDREKPLVLDPAMLVYAGYIGGAGNDQGVGIAVDSAGNAYVTGTTDSSEATFPVTVGPDLTFNGSFDAFVAKVNPAGTALVYAGYIGGAGSDQGVGIAVDSAGNAYVTGATDSPEATFPVTVGPDLTFNGSVDAFVAKVNPGGTALVYAGYIGGTGNDLGVGIAVDSAGNAYVTGLTDSSEATFPVTAGPDLTFNGSFDAFVAKVAGMPVEVSTPSKVTGGGAIDSSGNILTLATLLIQSGTNPGGKATLGFVVEFTSGGAAPTGNLTYNDHEAQVRIKAIAYQLLVISDVSPVCPTVGKHAKFTGTADVNGVQETFEVEVDDCGEPGDADTFSIKTATYSASGILLSGNIQIHSAQ